MPRSRSKFKKKKSILNQSNNSRISMISNNKRTSKIEFQTKHLDITQENKNLLGSLVQEDGKGILQDPKKSSTILKEEKVINSKKITHNEEEKLNLSNFGKKQEINLEALNLGDDPFKKNLNLNINNLDEEKEKLNLSNFGKKQEINLDALNLGDDQNLNVNIKNIDEEEKFDVSNFGRQKPIDMNALNLGGDPFKKNEGFDIKSFIEKSTREIQDNLPDDFEDIDNVEDLKMYLRKNQFVVKNLKDENEDLKKEKREIQKNLDILRNQVNELKLEKRIFQKRTMEFATLDRNIIEQQLKNLEESNPKEDKFLMEIAEENKKLAKRSLEKTARMQKMKDDIEELRQNLERMSF